jgi:hypothetical protein
MSDIESLAMQKSFVELDTQERAQVLAIMSVEEYSRLHNLLSATRVLDADVSPPLALQERLLARMAERQSAKRPAPTLLQLRVPAWQAAAAIMLALFSGRFLQPSAPTSVQQTTVQTVVRQDTVFHEKTVWRERVVVQWKERPAAEAIPSGDISLLQNIDSMPVVEEYLNAPLIFDPAANAAGVPLSEQPELLQFFTQLSGQGHR